MQVLEQALEKTTHESQTDQTDDEWTTSVTNKSVQAAGIIIRHFNNQKFIMLRIDDTTEASDCLSKQVIKLLSIETRNGDGIVLPSEVSQKHISDKVGSSYPTSKAVELISEAARLGYGTIDNHETPNKRVVKRFRKRKLDELNTECTEALKRACISDDIYGRAFVVRMRNTATLEE